VPHVIYEVFNTTAYTTSLSRNMNMFNMNPNGIVVRFSIISFLIEYLCSLSSGMFLMNILTSRWSENRRNNV